jgi:riboflavin synthase
MFTGLVEEVGVVQALKKAGPGVRLQLRAAAVAKDAKIGDSIAVNGCCLTVVAKDKSLLSFEAGQETLNRTNFGRLKKGSRVNLERSLKLGDRLGGHYVTGHIDGTATLVKRRDDDDWSNFTFRVPSRLSKQMASKGSVALDGVSLTLVVVENDSFSVALIPHTLTHTTLAGLAVGDLANIETDLLAKYVERQMNLHKAKPMLS